MQPGLPAIVLLAIATSLHAVEATGELPYSRLPRQAADDSVSDFYYHAGVPFRLVRSPREIVVRFATATVAERQTLIRSLGADAALGPRILSEGRAFDLIVLPADGADLATTLVRVRAIDDIEFAAPVFYHPASRARLVPTDELILKLKRATGRTDLDAVLVTRGLTVVRQMVGSSDEFDVRLPRGPATDPLAESRTLYETGRFEWVEPNFVREIDKGQNLR